MLFLCRLWGYRSQLWQRRRRRQGGARAAAADSGAVDSLEGSGEVRPPPLAQPFVRSGKRSGDDMDGSGEEPAWDYGDFEWDPHHAARARVAPRPAGAPHAAAGLRAPRCERRARRLPPWRR